MILYYSLEPLANGRAGNQKLEVPIRCTYRKSVLISANFGDMG